jgi:uncharacterized membrane protein YebE (DUF533 family)
MFDAKDLLGQLLQSSGNRATRDRIGHALNPQGPGGQGDALGGLLGGIAGEAGSVFGRVGRSVGAGDPLAVGGLAALAGAVLGGGGKSARGALGAGALALLGSLAYSALSKGREPAAGAAAEAPLELREPHTAAEEQAVQQTALVVLKAMVHAAKADGAVDAAEMDRILGRLDEAGADSEARAFILEEMRRPGDLDGLIAQVSSPELAVEVYAASLLAITVDTPGEKEYMRRLAAGLHLDGETVGHIHAQLGVELTH